jgi:hypothetical protein
MIGSNIFRLRALAYPMHWSQQLVDHYSHRGIVPDVPKLRPLEFWIDAETVGLNRLVYTKAWMK